jgi:tetratricopeptide (TPR) repeat protein
VGAFGVGVELDRAELALADYDRALMIEPEQPVVLASRAILHYEAGHLPEAVNDLGAALELAPDLAEVYQNRAVALRELGQCDEAARDLSTYLELCPDAKDRSEVEDTLSALAGQR